MCDLTRMTGAVRVRARGATRRGYVACKSEMLRRNEDGSFNGYANRLKQKAADERVCRFL